MPEPAQPTTIVEAAPVPQTSVDAYQPTEVTVRFNKTQIFNGTSYMRNQEAGFTRSQVAELARRGIVTVTHETRIAAGMVRKGG